MSTSLRTPLSRRRLAAIATAASLPLSLSHPARTHAQPAIAGTSLRILKPTSEIDGYDDAFRRLLTDWAGANDVTAQLDTVDAAELVTTFAGEIAAQQGHDLVEWVSPLAHFEENLRDLTDVWDACTTDHDAPLEFCQSATFNAVTNRHIAFVHGYVPLVGVWQSEDWDAVDLSSGPTTYDELARGGVRIRERRSRYVSLLLARQPLAQSVSAAVFQAYGASLQNADGDLTLDSKATRNATKAMQDLLENAMDSRVFVRTDDPERPVTPGTPPDASYTLAGLDWYRQDQTMNATLANNARLSPPLPGAAGDDARKAPPASMGAFHVPLYSDATDTATAFLQHLVSNYDQIVAASRLSIFPTYPSTVPDLDDQLRNDPFDSQPGDKLAFLTDASSWTVHPGWPGPMSPLISEALDEFILSGLLARVARYETDEDTAIQRAMTRLNDIRETWVARGLMR